MDRWECNFKGAIKGIINCTDCHSNALRNVLRSGEVAELLSVHYMTTGISRL